MKRKFIIICLMFGIIAPRFGLAYLEQTDTIFEDKEKAIYMIGSVFNRLTSAKSEPKEDSFKIYKINLKDNIKENVYQGANKSMDRMILSPDNNYITVLRREKYRFIDILLIDKKLKIAAQTIHEPDEIITYSWSPDSRKIAYLAGTLGERDKINAKGIWIFDIEKENKKKIAESALNVEWLPTGDLCLYIKSIEQKDGRRQTFYKTQIYSFQADKVISEKKGINLSQDGRYSVDPRYIGMGEMMRPEELYIDFFDLKEGKTILAESLDKIFTERARILWGPVLWLKNNRIVVEKNILVDPNNPYSGVATNVRDIFICDIEKNQVLKEFKGEIVGVNSDRSKLVIYSDGKFIAVDVP